MSEVSSVHLKVKVTPKSSRNRVGNLGPEGELSVYVTAVPANDKANLAVRKLLSKKLGIGHTSIQLIRGAHSHRKVYLLSNLDVDANNKLSSMLTSR